MLKRKIEERFKDWKQSNSNKFLIVEGARQVGKTYSIRQFGFKNYDSFIELNFIENPSLVNIFSGALDSDTILMALRLYLPDANIINGSTLIFLDEIQECSEAITALKFLADDPRFSVICSGSALGMNYKPQTSYPVGSVEHIGMKPLDFEEFLWALHVDDTITGSLRGYFRSAAEGQKIPDGLHNIMMTYLRQYLVLGGMPEVIQSFVDTKDYKLADSIQRRLYQDYLNDIARYAKPDIKIKAEKCYKTIPMQLSKENHKFQYSKVESKGTSTKFKSSIDWLSNAHMVVPVYNVRRLEFPLKSFAMDNNFRIYPNDIGFLVCTYGYELKAALLDDLSIDAAPGNILLGNTKGGIYESLAADMLDKAGFKDLFFYRNETGTIEMEFLIENQDGIVPIEIKAGRSRARSLSSVLENNGISYGYKFSSQNAGKSGKKITLPLYLLPFIK